MSSDNSNFIEEMNKNISNDKLNEIQGLIEEQMHWHREKEKTEEKLNKLKATDLNAGKEKYIAKVKQRNKMTHLTPKKKKRK